MLRSAIEKNRLYLTADLRAPDSMTLQPRDRMTPKLFATELKRFPPVEDVLASVDRIASRVFAA
jgi:hypothetical protein